MIYLIGVDHTVQHNRNHSKTKEFIAYLEEQIKSEKIDLIGEEWHEHFSIKNNVKTSTAQDVATKYGIEYKSCDSHPELEPRKKSYRESYWFSMIKNKIDRIIIFICGSNHLASFKMLLEAKGCQTIILPKKFDDIDYSPFT